MIKQIDFQVNDSSPVDKWIGFYAIQKNISKRISTLPELKFRKWDVVISDGHVENSNIDWDDERDLRMILFLDFQKIENCRERKSIEIVYELLFEGFSHIWNTKGWNKSDLKAIHEAIINEDYKVSIIHGKVLQSPDKKYKAEFYCELFPDYSDLFLRFVAKGNVIHQKIKFLKAHLNPDLFFGFFLKRYWRDDKHFFLADTNREIFYIFNLGGTFSIEYKPIYNSLEECQNYVQAFHADVSHAEMMRLLGLPS